MNFYNEQENEKKEGAPVLPRSASPFKKTSAFGKTPLFSRTAGSLMDRIKNLSRRDMALVGLGLSVLVMVPVAEYMMSQPPQENLLDGGWGGKEKLGDMPYEPGVNGLSQGSADGSGEVITPLSSRDPVSLILGSQPAQPAVTAPVYTPPATSMRDAMRDAGREAFSAASKSAGAPTVIPKMAGGLRNMSFFGGGESSRTSGSLGGGKIIDEARSASSKAAKRSMVGPVAIAGYKGVASTPNSASKGAFEKLRAAADKSAGNFSGGSAIRSLDKAAADALEIGKGGGGMGAGGDSDKTGKTSGNSVKGYEHNRSGESLAEAAAKLRQQKALEWEFYKKYEIPKQIINAILGAVTNVMGEFIKDKLMSAFGMYPPNIKCWNPAVCPSGGNCGDLAVTYLGANWWNNGKKLTDLCSVGGNPVAIKQVVGKESASSTSEVCLCGKGEKPAIGGSSAAAASATADPAANPGGNVNATPQHHAQAVIATMKSYDEQLRSIVGQVNEAEKVDVKDMKEDLVTGIVGALQNLSPLADNKIQAISNLKDSVNSANTQFNTDLEAAKSKVEGFRPDYEKFNKVWEKLNSECPPVEAGKTPQCTIKPKVEAGKESVLTQAAITSIRSDLKRWNNEGRPLFSGADGMHKAMQYWKGAYGTELGNLRDSVIQIGKDKNEFFNSVAQANPKDKPVIDRLKGITGRFEKVQAAPAEGTAAKTGETAPQTGVKVDPSTTPLYKIAVSQRAADWEVLWKSPYDIDSTKVSGPEASAFAEWENKVSKAAAEDAAVPPLVAAKNFVDCHMRATELSRSILVNNVSVKKISADVDDAKRVMEEVKKSLATYIDGATYDLGNTAAVKPDNPPVDNPKPPTDDNSQTGGVNYTAANANVGNLGNRVNTMRGEASTLPDGSFKTNAVDSLNAADKAVEKMRTAQATLKSKTATPEEKAKAQADFDEAKKTYSTEMGKARGYINQGSQRPNQVNVTVPDNTVKDSVSAADRQKSEARRETLVDCVPLTNGWGTLEKKCTLDQAQTVKTGVTFANTQLARGLTDRDVSAIRATAYSACGWVKKCNPKSVPDGCGEFGIYPAK